jgi:hypothetical protein
MVTGDADVTTRTDSFDHSDAEAFVQSRIDARNRSEQQIIDQPRGMYAYIVLLHESMDPGNVNINPAYLEGPSAPPPVWCEDSPEGIARWEAHYQHWNTNRAAWARDTGEEFELVAGTLHHKGWSHTYEQFVTLPVVPWVRNEWLTDWPYNQVEVRGTETPEDYDILFERLTATTLETVAPDSEIFGLVVMDHFGGRAGSMLPLRARWLEWAQDTYRNVPQQLPGIGWPHPGIQWSSPPGPGVHSLWMWLFNVNWFIGHMTWP